MPSPFPAYRLVTRRLLSVDPLPSAHHNSVFPSPGQSAQRANVCRLCLKKVLHFRIEDKMVRLPLPSTTTPPAPPPRPQQQQQQFWRTGGWRVPDPFILICQEPVWLTLT